jgi:hypothetical protein
VNYYNYFTEIEETFIRRRGKNLLLSPLDWALIEDWQHRQIPLHVVIRAIETVFDLFDRQPERPRTIKSLLYCREEIEAQHAEWLKLQVGGSGNGGSGPAVADAHGFSTGAIDAHLDSVTASLETVGLNCDPDLQATLERVLSGLADIRKHREDAEKLERSLEHLIDQCLLGAPAAKTLKKEVTSQLASYKKAMDPESYKRTFDLMLIKRLREDARLPRLSLYYL